MKLPNVEQKEIYSILKKYWGYDEFRPMQLNIINSVLAGRDTLALMPTGGGKSITYQVPALLMDGVCIVITPLIALMKDQVDRLRSLSVPATAVHAGLSQRQIDIALDNCVYGDTKFLFVSPERVATEMFRYRVQRMNVSMIAVDESHCISQWGYDFRPTYLKIAELRAYTDNAPILALTASATKKVVKDIIERLKFKDEVILKGSFSRKNLVYAVRDVDDKDGQFEKVLNSVPGSGIVYVRTRRAAEVLTKMLTNKGVSATFYHAGLPHTERSLRQEEWINNEVRVIVATNAFGMGIDKPDVRFVVHYTVGDSLENYYQEAGRAGRDGKKSYALLLYASRDIDTAMLRFKTHYPPLKEIKKIYDLICSHLQIPIGDGAMTSYLFNMYEFSAKHKLFVGSVSNAIKILEANGYMSLTDEMANPARIMFCVSRDDLYKVRVSHDSLDHFLRVILRLYSGLFTEFRPISEAEIAHWSGYTIFKVKELLTRLWQMRLIKYVPSNQSPLLYLECERLDVDDIYISPETYAIRKEQFIERFEQMVSYAQNTTVCRSRIFEKHFGVDDNEDCGVCDICLEKNKSLKNNIEEQIFELLSKSDMTVRELVMTIHAPTTKIADKIEELLEEEKIDTTREGLLTLLK